MWLTAFADILHFAAGFDKDAGQEEDDYEKNEKNNVDDLCADTCVCASCKCRRNR